MCREEVRAATISSTASCREEDGTEAELLRADTAADSRNLDFNVALHECGSKLRRFLCSDCLCRSAACSSNSSSMVSAFFYSIPEQKESVLMLSNVRTVVCLTFQIKSLIPPCFLLLFKLSHCDAAALTEFTSC